MKVGGEVTYNNAGRPAGAKRKNLETNPEKETIGEIDIKFSVFTI